VTDPKQGLDLAFKALCEASDFTVAELHFGHVLSDFYSLFELAKQPPSAKASRDAALEATGKGKTALAIVWARKFRTHDIVEVSQAAAIHSNYYTNLYGVLAWRPRSDFTASTDGRDWHLYYDRFLAGRPVLDTLQTGAAAVIAATPAGSGATT
jgi:hypothetical protein